MQTLPSIKLGEERNKPVVPLIQLAFFFFDFSKERKISKF
jgi:hypothetical protein